MQRLDLTVLDRSDLEALVALKLLEEVGIGPDASRALVVEVNDAWLRSFLGSGPPAIGGEVLGRSVLRRARIFRRRSAVRCLIEPPPDK